MSDPRVPHVVAVFDPDGGGSDFAYTTSLSDEGLFELHLWARPVAGEDPGEDWALSPGDCNRMLVELAELQRAGELGAGWTRRDVMDGGFGEIHLEVGEPVDAGEVDAFHAPPGARVLPVRWSLVRDSIAPADEGSDQARAAMEQLALELGGSGNTAGGNEYGPASVAVRALCERAGSMRIDRLVELGLDAVRLGGNFSPSWELSVLRGAARAAGRTEALARALDAAGAAIGARRAEIAETLGDDRDFAHAIGNAAGTVFAAIVGGCVLEDVPTVSDHVAVLAAVRASHFLVDEVVDGWHEQPATRSVLETTRGQVETADEIVASDEYQEALARVRGRLIGSGIPAPSDGDALGANADGDLLVGYVLATLVGVHGLADGLDEQLAILRTGGDEPAGS